MGTASVIASAHTTMARMIALPADNPRMVRSDQSRAPSCPARARRVVRRTRSAPPCTSAAGPRDGARDVRRSPRLAGLVPRARRSVIYLGPQSSKVNLGKATSPA